MPFVIGTAGHIDHGKTSLVKALTGIDTDRLEEEKARGISIELGFAHLDLPGTRAGIVDVPGHERFIRHMLAGAHGLDLVLFTVAADDGVMPQTEEHVAILHLLGIEHAIFVVTKADLVPDARLADVEQDIRILAAGTALENAPVVPFSFVTGRGLDALRARIAETLEAFDRPARPGYFRLPIDRAFALRGHGLVVTGTALAGQVGVGDRLRALPSNQVFRVRGVQVHNEPVPHAVGGQRVALNLSAQDGASIERGQVLCDERLSSGSTRFDASIEACATGTASPALKHHQRVRVHVGTSERMARVVLLGGEDRVDSGHTAFCQIVLSDPVLVLRGDRFVLRDEAAQRTLGGGVVLHPWPRVRRRRDVGLQRSMATLQRGDLAQVSELYIDDQDTFAVPIGPIREFLNRTDDQLASALADAAGIRVIELEGGAVYTTQTKWLAARDALLTALRAFHASHPLAAGREMETLRDTLPAHTPAHVFRAVIAQLEAESLLARDGSVLRLPGHTVALGGRERDMAERIVRLLRDAPLSPPDLPQLEATLAVERGRLLDVLRVLEADAAIVRVAVGLYFLTDSLTDLKRVVRSEFASADPFTPAAFRNRFGTSRKYAIPLLEYLDREGVTVRVGEARRLRSAAP